MIDCDTNDSGCSGGNLDDAWKFLLNRGLPSEQCYPYRHWPGPPPPPPPPACTLAKDTNWAPTNESIMTIGIDSAQQCCSRCGSTPNCAVGVYQPPGLCHLKSKANCAGGAVHAPGYLSGTITTPGPHPKQACPTTCKNGSAIAAGLAKLRSAYAVGAPGDVEAMQRELMTHGPFEVGFEVFSDFSSYKNGTYSRSPGATGPGGGHAVKLVGWGVDERGVAYW